MYIAKLFQNEQMPNINKGKYLLDATSASICKHKCKRWAKSAPQDIKNKYNIYIFDKSSGNIVEGFSV